MYVNETNGDTGYGSIYYDYSVGGLRTDFFPICPFRELQKKIPYELNFSKYTSGWVGDEMHWEDREWIERFDKNESF